jgi:hypothetical protein
MNYSRIAVAVLCAFVAYMALGGLLFAAIPALKNEFLKFPAVYRSQQSQMSHMPAGMAGMFLSIAALAVLYAMMHRAGSSAAGGAIFGVLIGLFAVGAFVLHNYVNLNIGIRITLFSAAAYMLEWTVVGVILGLIYRPA